MEIDLSGTVVLVTGASRGIGQAIARQLAASGATTAVHYHRNRASAQALVEETDAPARAFQADLSKVAGCQRLFGEVLDAFGHLDVLVNNAGVAVSLPMEEPVEQWQEGWALTMNVNLRAPALLCRLAIEHFRERGGGRIINIASRAAFRGDTPDYMAYAASKGGLVALTRSIARGFGKEGIRAFVLAPGFTRTDMAQDFIDAYGEDYALRGIALERLTEPGDIAPLAVFLASGRADHATGATIDINAGSYVH